MSLLCLLTVLAGGMLKLADSCSPRPVDGSWGSWTAWSSCSQSCGGGTETRRRLCDSPAPAVCQGNGLEQRQCNTRPCPVPGFLISGGDPRSSRQNAELYNPASGNSCPVQDLQQSRRSHSSCGGLVCGGDGWSSWQSCERITGTEVSSLSSLTLRTSRHGHLCWSLPAEKVLLLGDYGTEIVSGSSSSEGFTLPYRTKEACGMEVGDHYIVTGGYARDAPDWALNTVAKYSQSGLVDYLPSLNQRRYAHACSSFISDSGETVLMVTGGGHISGGTSFTRLESTEMLVVSPGRSWRTLTTARLPSPRYGLRAGTADNVVFVFGGYDGSYLNTILSFNKAEESWQPAGQMSVRRSHHAVEKIDSISLRCP